MERIRKAKMKESTLRRKPFNQWEYIHLFTKKKKGPFRLTESQTLAQFFRDCQSKPTSEKVEWNPQTKKNEVIKRVHLEVDEFEDIRGLNVKATHVT